MLTGEPTAPVPPPGHRRPVADRSRLAALLVLGGWFLVEAVVLSLSKGIVHPYYVSALGPGTGAMAGAGAVAFVELARGRDPRRIAGLALTACAVAGDRRGAGRAAAPRALHGLVRPRAVGGSRRGSVRAAGPAPPGGAGGRVHVPAAARRADRLLGHHVARAGRGHLPGGRTQARPPAPAPMASTPVTERIDRALADYVSTHDPGTRWALLTVASDTAVSDDPVRPGRGRPGRLQRHRPRGRRPPARALGGKPAKLATCCSAASTRCAAATAPRTRSCGPARSWRHRSGTARSPTPTASRCSTAPGTNARWQLPAERSYAATDRSWWNARANSSVSRLAAQRGTAASPSAISAARPSPRRRGLH